MNAGNDWALKPAAFDQVACRDLTRAFGRTHALYRCAVELRGGTVTAVVGPNGAGKTTLLHLLATLDRPTEGSLTFGAAQLDSVRHRRRIRPHIGVVAHDSLLYSDLTGIENLNFCAAMYGLDPGLSPRWVARVGLERDGDRLVSTYSRGMRQRLSIARALMPEPSLVLFDEPLTGLDRAARGFLFETITRLRDAGRVVVVVTHHLDWPPSSLDRVVVLDAGRVRFDGVVSGSLAELYSREIRA